ncbi:MAG: hypothetical protein NTV22_13445 [bacterium]|nr:hypothetical protein [bacterium]
MTWCAGIIIYGSMVALTACAYEEFFSSNANWFGGSPDMFTALFYTNSAPERALDVFSADAAKRETNVTHSTPYAWRVGFGTHYFRYATPFLVTNFSVYLARTGADVPDLQIRYSNNSGATYTYLYTGTALLSGVPQATYTQYVAPAVGIVAQPGQMNYIEVQKFFEWDLLVDDVCINGVIPEPRCAALLALLGCIARVRRSCAAHSQRGWS